MRVWRSESTPCESPRLNPLKVRPSIARRIVVLATVLLTASHAFGQEHTHAEPQDPSHVHGVEGGYPSEASGTSWLPAATPMYGWTVNRVGWELMAHANVFAQFLLESGEIHRRGQQFGGINWVMGMATRAVGQGRVKLQTMLSAEPWTIRGCGYPDLLATGEICERDTIHDRQHPHDLFMEVAAAYERPLSSTVRWQIYAAPAGEPALGPTAFPHRPSSMSNPLAPITHHWLDSTHISFGVVTSGVYSRHWKAEASVFNGREPDPIRTDFDFGRLDAFAARLSIASGNRWTFQASAGRLPQAEAGPGRLPRTDVTRETASISYQGIGEGRFWATTIAYGVNSQRTVIPEGRVYQIGHALLAETSNTFRHRNTVFGRIEIVGKPAHDFHADQYATLVFTVGKVEAGYLREMRQWHGFVPGVGGMAMLSITPPLLAPYYGGRLVPGFGVFLNLRPSVHSMSPSSAE